MSVLPVDIKTLLNYTVSESDIKKYQSLFEEQVASDNVEPSTKFQYAICLIHSKNYSDVKKGASLFEDMFKEGSEEVKRELLFCMAIAETRQRNYYKADEYLKGFLSVKPTNVKAQELHSYVKSQLEKDGVTSMALFGTMGVLGAGAAVVLGTKAIGKFQCKDGVTGMALLGAMGVLGGGAAVVLSTIAIEKSRCKAGVTAMDLCLVMGVLGGGAAVVLSTIAIEKSRYKAGVTVMDLCLAMGVLGGGAAVSLGTITIGVTAVIALLRRGK